MDSMDGQTKFATRILAAFTLTLALSGCSSKSVNNNAPAASELPHYVDTEIQDLARQYLDEQRHLANVRSAKQNALANSSQPVPSPNGAIFSGLETKRTILCEGCDIKVVSQAIAVLLGWDINSVYETGRKPALGVPVTIDLDNQPLRIALEQIKADAGHVMDLRIDPNFKSMLIEYKTITR